MSLKEILSGFKKVSNEKMFWNKGKLKIPFSDNKVPDWIKKKTFPCIPDVSYKFKGNTFIYKLIITRSGAQGSAFEYVFFRVKR